MLSISGKHILCVTQCNIQFLTCLGETGAHVEMFPSRKTPFGPSTKEGKEKEEEKHEKTEAEEREADTSLKCIKA